MATLLIFFIVDYVLLLHFDKIAHFNIGEQLNFIYNIFFLIKSTGMGLVSQFMFLTMPISVSKFKSHINLYLQTPEHLRILDNEHNRRYIWAH